MHFAALRLCMDCGMCISRRIHAPPARALHCRNRDIDCGGGRACNGCAPTLAASAPHISLRPIVDHFPLAHLWPSAFKVAGFCETVYPPILGLSLPAWSLVALLLIFA